MARIAELEQFKDIAKLKWSKLLSSFNVRHIEQLATLLASPTGQIALARLGIDPRRRQLSDRVDEYLKSSYGAEVSLSSPYGSGTGFSLLLPKNIQRPLGYTAGLGGLEFNEVIPFPKGEPPSEPAEDNGDEPPGSHFILDDFPEVRDQRYRGTCVAFATIAMLEAFIAAGHAGKWSRIARFSEQYLFYRAKQSDPDQISDGTKFEYALDALREFGVCPDSLLPYTGYHDWGQALIFKHAHKLRRLDDTAHRNRISTYEHLSNARSVREIKESLLQNLAVGIGIPVFHDAWFNGYAEQRGEIQLPLTVVDENGDERLLDTFVGGHALTLYGYEDDEDTVLPGRPGGGFFVFRNSWGSDWASGNNTVNEPGYGQLPYAYIERYCLDACVITGTANSNNTGSNS